MDDTFGKVMRREEEQAGGSGSNDELINDGDISEIQLKKLTTHNVLASADLNCQIDLEVACAAFWNCVYMPQEFQTTRVDIRSKRGGIICVSIFSNGKILATGGTTVTETKNALRKVAKRLRDSPTTQYSSIRLTNFEVANLLAVYNVGSPIRLTRLSRYLRGIDYEPERFPGAKYRVPIGELKRRRSSKRTSSVDSTLPVPANSTSSSPSSLTSPYESQEKMTSGGAWTTSTGSTADYRKVQGATVQRIEVVTANIFSTGNLSFTGGRSIGSIRKALETILPAVKCCLANTNGLGHSI